ncbi:hypothetical protein [Sporosarcina globispora]|nr:hypothetical protein [Sporosarcina globispora]
MRVYRAVDFLEKGSAWDSAVNLYKRFGYKEDKIEDGMIHLSKEI